MAPSPQPPTLPTFHPDSLYPCYLKLFSPNVDDSHTIVVKKLVFQKLIESVEEGDDISLTTDEEYIVLVIDVITELYSKIASSPKSRSGF